MNFDGSLTLQVAGAGVVLTSPDEQILKYAIQLDFQSTNNMAEYDGLLVELRAVVGLVDNKHIWDHLVDASITTMKYQNGLVNG
jgi:ribonuclease HI